jgi:hypothetical protein
MTRIRAKDIDTGWGEDSSLFPPQGKEKATLAIERIRKVLERERSMREKFHCRRCIWFECVLIPAYEVKQRMSGDGNNV